MTVTVKKVGKDEYEAWNVTPHFDEDGKEIGSTLDPIYTGNISRPIPYGLSVDAWAADLDDKELEAALIIFTERWTWDNGQREDKVCLEALEREKERRDEQENWLHGANLPGIFHGQAPANPVEGMMHIGPNGKVTVFNKGQWCPVTITSQQTINHATGQASRPSFAVSAMPPAPPHNHNNPNPPPVVVTTLGKPRKSSP